MNIFENCLGCNMNLEIEQIPREITDQVDYSSLIVDFDDWGIAQCLFDDISCE